MTGRVLVPALATLLWGQTAFAQPAAWRFRWQPGQVLVYRVEQQTQATEQANGSKVETKTRMKLVKRWQVLAVDAEGVATIQHSLVSLRIEATPPSGETLLFDSTAPDKSNPAMGEQLSKFVGVPLATLRLDTLGRLVEVKESKFGPASRFEAELPFAITLPTTTVRPGQSWQRDYQITLEPPQGTGEKYAAVQTHTCKRIEPTGISIGVQTELKALPQALADQIPLLRSLPQGEVLFDVRTGRVQRIELRVQKELKGHRGEGSNYHFESNYTEVYTGDR
jgi:hypothetical protein